MAVPIAPSQAAWWMELIRDIPDFPTGGVVFRDITPLLADGAAFDAAVNALASAFACRGVDKVVGVEARGFILASPVALRLGAGFVPVRKAGKLPYHVESESYQLEYGSETLEIHRDGLSPGERVIVVDDVLATGGTAAAAVRLVERLEAEVVGLGFLVELRSLGGRVQLAGRETVSLMEYG
jgi:adenine phosphoribosyltransferase